MLSDIQIPSKLLLPFHSIYLQWQKTVPSLEHSPSSRRAGGRGMRPKKSKSGPKKRGYARLRAFFAFF